MSGKWNTGKADLGYNENPALENLNKHAKDALKQRYNQDLPPPGRFPVINHARKPPLITAPSGAVLFGLSVAVMTFGFYRIGQTNHERRAWEEEKKAARQTLVPLLQAEEDLRWCRAKKEQVELETLLMENVPGWQVNENVYNNGKWYAPWISHDPSIN